MHNRITFEDADLKLELRFGGIFYLGPQLIFDQDGNGRYRLLETNVFTRRARVDICGLVVAGVARRSSLRGADTYSIQGPVFLCQDGRTILFEERWNTVRLRGADVTPVALVNKVTTEGTGKVLEWFGRPGLRGTLRDEVCVVRHRMWNSLVSVACGSEAEAKTDSASIGVEHSRVHGGLHFGAGSDMYSADGSPGREQHRILPRERRDEGQASGAQAWGEAHVMYVMRIVWQYEDGVAGHARVVHSLFLVVQ
ncbi:uncharacterized protein MELLADRAFT_107901 [Melampsora larici-populina 98AG31]|uniref:Uncharacterized protein n=1 Tax=Melampsora larici-populina (strain 98AG31 / pathotype 3-4-7) TaxID=747676 RepID=F4RRB6_MELLP|nr:uncharacterized protein MELLADRAFT_107901 [Melampsora larici-populina 98AG31]EGG05063.1 hypothetical protein MELLADRAFT_107901 [Melampsora larici-populina 98AG31]